MTTATMGATQAMEQDNGFTARMIATWTVAGGVITGGFVVAGLSMVERVNGNGLLVTATGMFMVGAFLGAVAGAVLGWFGRPAGVTWQAAARRLAVAAAWTVPAVIVAMMATGWIAMTTVALYLRAPLPMVGVGLAWAVGLVFVAAAAVEGWTALENTGRRLTAALAPRTGSRARAAAA